MIVFESMIVMEREKKMATGFVERLGRVVMVSSFVSGVLLGGVGGGVAEAGVPSHWVPDDGLGGYFQVGNWSDPDHWNNGTGTVPLTDHDVALGNSAIGHDPYTINLNINTTIESLSMLDSRATTRFVMSGRHLVVTDATNLHYGVLDVTSSTLTDDNGVDPQIGSIIFGDGILANRDLFYAHFKGSSQIRHLSGVSNRGNIVVEGTASNANLTVSHLGINNTGVVHFTSTGGGQAQLSITSGALINQVGGEVLFSDGTGGNKTRVLNGNLTNHGFVSVGSTTHFIKTGGLYENMGQFDVVGGKALSLAGGGTFRMSDGTLDNQGSFSLGAGSTFDFMGGVISGNAVVLSGSRLNLGAGAGSGVLNVFGGSQMSGDVNAGNTVNILGNTGHTTVTADDSFVNYGMINLSSTGGGHPRLVVGGGHELTNFGVFNFADGAGGNKNRYFSGDLVNNGLTHVSTGTYFDRVNGVYTNHGVFLVDAGKVFTINGGGRVFNQADGDFELNGTSNFNAMTFNYDGGLVIGSSAVTMSNSVFNIGVGSGDAGEFVMTGNSQLSGDIKAHQIVRVMGNTGHTTVTSAGSFDNAGLLYLSSTGGGHPRLIVGSDGILTNTGVLEFADGSGGNKNRYFAGHLLNDVGGDVLMGTHTYFDKTGGVYSNYGDFTVTSGKVFTINGGGQVFNQEDGIFTVNGSIAFNAMTLNFNGGDIVGNPLTLSNSRINFGASHTDTGEFVLTGGSIFSGHMKTNQVLRVMGNAGHTTVTTVGDVVNEGLVYLSSTGGGQPRLNMETGKMFMNQGVLDFADGSGGNKNRYFGGDLLNDGTVRVGTHTYFDRAGSVYTNNGQFEVVGGKTFTISGAHRFVQQGGQFVNDGTTGFTGMTFDYLGGSVVGSEAVRMSGGRLNMGVGSGDVGEFVMTGGGVLNGHLKANQVLRVMGNTGHTTVTTVGEVANHGLVYLSSTGGGQARLNMEADKAFMNQGVLDFADGSGGNKNRYFGGDLLNDGTVRVGTHTYFDRAGSVYTNNGQFEVVGGKTFTISGAHRFVQQGGQFVNDGTTGFTGMTFDYLGGSVVGSEAVRMSGGRLNMGVGSGDVGEFVMTGNGVFNGHLKANQTVRVMGNTGHTTVTTVGDVINDGLVYLSSTGGGQPRLNMEAGKTFTNHGVLDFADGSGGNKSRYFGGNLNNATGGLVKIGTTTYFDRADGDFDNHGDLVLEGGKLVMTGDTFTNHVGGVVSGNGTLNGTGLVSFVNLGTFSVGASVGQINVTGDFEQGASGIIAVELDAGLTADRLAISGDAILEGRLEIDLLGGYDGVVGSVYTVLTADEIFGVFDTLGLADVTSGTFLRLFYEESAVRVAVISEAYLGDTDGDFDVDQDDLDNVMAHLGSDSYVGDGTGDGVTNLDDLFAVRNNFGRVAPVVAIPEPGVLGLLLIGGMMVGHRRRQ